MKSEKIKKITLKDNIQYNAIKKFLIDDINEIEKQHKKELAKKFKKKKVGGINDNKWHCRRKN